MSANVAFVSIQGLVLVREPYFCEPAFEKMRGTAEGSTNRCVTSIQCCSSDLRLTTTNVGESSRMYNEKTYVLARGFVLHALQHPVTNFSEEIQWLYHTRGKLNKVLQGAHTLIERSQQNGVVDEPARPEDADRPIQRLTLGAMLPLARILTKLQAISDSR
jgi:ubiquitin-conjugating enzyme E2 O